MGMKHITIEENGEVESPERNKLECHSLHHTFHMNYAAYEPSTRSLILPSLARDVPEAAITERHISYISGSMCSQLNMKHFKLSRAV
jgi:hypothetical protein